MSVKRDKKPATKRKKTSASSSSASSAGKVAAPVREKSGKPPAKTAKAPAKTAKAPATKARSKDDAELGRELLRDLTALVARANDRAVEQILGDGGLESFLDAVVPQKQRPTHTVHQHLAAHKRRASLMAQVRHAINESCSFADGGAYVSPTRVQWFYDGLTFLVGNEPFSGVVGFYREGELRYGLALSDVPRGRSLGPRDTDFVSVEHAKKSLRAGLGDARTGLSDLMTTSLENADDTTGFIDILERQPWMLGAQHVNVTRQKGLDNPAPDTVRRPSAFSSRLDEDLPHIFAKRSSDGFHDIIILAPPATPTVGKNGKVLSSLHDHWHRAERYLSFVERQSDYLAREMQLKVREPRCWLIAGAGLTPEERNAIREEKEAHTMALRFLTYDDLRALAARTLTFFEPLV